MVLDLKPIFLNDKKSLSLNCELDFSNVELNDGFPLKKPAKVSGSVYNRAEVVNLSVVCLVEYDAMCDRCGNLSIQSYKVPIERVLATEVFNENSDEIIVVEDYKLDLFELCRCEVILSLPMKHLCKKDCKGVCQICGKNLNDGPCNCATQRKDPRLEKLGELLK